VKKRVFFIMGPCAHVEFDCEVALVSDGNVDLTPPKP